MNELTEPQAPTVNPDLASPSQNIPTSAPSANPEMAVEASGSRGPTLLNATRNSAEFRVLQGTLQVARIGVAPGASAVIPLGSDYSVQAMTNLGSFTLTSAPLTFDATSVHLLAQMKMSDSGLYEFQLVQANAAQPDTFLFENTWRNPVQFTVALDGNPTPAVLVVDKNNTVTVSTAQQWDIYAIIDGITTQTVRTDNPGATITAVQDANEDGYALVVS
jgi:hypothetical protein